jgi:hypothetical protein
VRLARANSAGDPTNPAITALAASGELDLLQLDYAWLEPSACSIAFLEQLRALHKHFFLEPDLRLITNAGGGNVVPCVEALGGYLREHGDSAMPITAVRGDNLLPRLSELTAAGIEFTDEATGDSLLAIEEPLLAAQVELGAGPLATAWEEGSRMIVAGCYDPAAPFIAATKSTFQLAWDDYHSLASVAVAAHAVRLVPAIGVILAPDEVSLELASQEGFEAESFSRRLQKLATGDGMLLHADVASDVSSLALRPTEFGSLSVTGVRGREPDGSWRVRLTFAAGLVVDSPQTVHRWSRVPRDAVNVSVDTRPAAEWL